MRWNEDICDIKGNSIIRSCHLKSVCNYQRKLLVMRLLMVIGVIPQISGLNI